MVSSRPSVQLIRWPADAVLRHDLASRNIPRLLLVDGEAAPPRMLFGIEDWIRVPANEHDMFLRIARLEARHGELEPPDVSLDDLVVRHGGRWIALSPIEARLIAPLLAHAGRLVTNDELAAAGWDDSRARSMRSRISGLRRRVAKIGLRLTTVRGRGFVLELGEGPSE